VLFQSQAFLLVFLPLVLAVWYAAARSAALREWTLIAGSLVFYAWWDPRFLPLLLGQVLVSWGIAELYVRTGRRARWLLVAGIAANLAVLVFFKYWAFLAGNIAAASGFDIPAMSVVLPIGISFFTFEIISYLADLGWGGAPRYPLRRFTLFVALFPRLIAGPIVRHHEIIPQFDLDPWREGLSERLAKGATLLVIGLVKKVFLADALAPVADHAFAEAATGTPGALDAWSGALAFTFQLFLDFSAYSEMAIGIALMLGLTLPQNFDAPYRATSIREFWRRWHMTLSRYLRDYVYIPLGGSRHGTGRYVAATLATMGLCGLWHGAGWMFVAWGLLHGAALLVCRLWERAARPMPNALAWALTFLFVVAGWVVFRAPNFEVAGTMLGSMAGLTGFAGAFAAPWLIAAAAAVSLLGPTTYEAVTRYLRPEPGFAVLAATAAAAVVLAVGAGQPKSFIYFQF
jgi:D-alanyl-lipoteichoic acid acyltransferase DltB (MBOAT superfamily)